MFQQHDQAENRAYLKREFNRINKKMDFSMLNVLLATQAKEYLENYKNLFPELHKDQINQLIFALAKFSFVKMQGLKQIFFM